MSKALNDDAIQAGKAILLVARLAGYNFPADTKVEVSSSGVTPANSRILVSSYALCRLVEAGIEAIAKKSEGAE